jgi:hypothetical protein
MKKLKENYWAATPVIARKIGDSLLIASLGLTGGVMALPIEDETKLWVNFGIAGLGTVGKIITNLFTTVLPPPEPPTE